ncbi:hypothetical protein [Cloacibacillus porcorum]|jgi:hypothetical protein|nr:hypothetical protein [Cloacibacillus porcorum]
MNGAPVGLKPRRRKIRLLCESNKLLLTQFTKNQIPATIYPFR